LLGVTQYLTREANLATLSGIAACSASGSQLVFTYVDQRELGAEQASDGSGRLQVAFAAAREPWISGFDPSVLPEDLATIGFTLLEDLDGVAIKDRYCAGRKDLRPMPTSHIVHAELGGKSGVADAARRVPISSASRRRQLRLQLFPSECPLPCTESPAAYDR
jgi:O-methyltransferase involved in polyketide biosynthesis